MKNERFILDMDYNFPEIPPSSFYGRKSFAGLQDAADAIEKHSRREVNVVVLPPEPDTLTDEEDFDENNLTEEQIPNDIPGTIEIDFGDNVDSEEWDASDEEPLAKLRCTHISNVSKENLFSWKRGEPIYHSFENVDGNALNDQLEKVKIDLKESSPIQIFEKIFDKNIFQLIIDQSTIYTQQKNIHDFVVTVEEIKNFIGILLLSGYHKLPQQRMCWSLDEDLGVEIVSKCMSRNRFLEIKRYLHLADNTKINKKDKMYKLRPLMDALNKNF